MEETAQNHNHFFLITLLVVVLLASSAFIFRDQLMDLASGRESQVSDMREIQDETTVVKDDASDAEKEVPQGDVVLSFSDTSFTIAEGETKDVSVMIDSGEESVSIVELQLGVNSRYLEIVDIKPGTFFAGNTELKKEISENGAVYALGTVNVKPGSGELLTLTLRGKAQGQSSLTIKPETQIRAIKKDINVLKETVEATVIVE